MSVTRTIAISDITPEELAELFTEMGGEQQAEFFAAIKPISDKWPGAGWCAQSYAINLHLNAAGLSVLETLASHLPAETLARLAEQALR
jgi:hypothetical protein